MQLVSESGGLALRSPAHLGYGAVRPGWDSADIRRRVAAGRRQPLARALGLHKASKADNASETNADQGPLQILDATAGLGRDAWVVAALGARVTLLERSAPVAAMLRDALEHARGDAAMQNTANRLTVHHGDACSWLGAHTRSAWDAIYLDPMYPEDGKRALPTKAMQFLRELTGGDADADALLALARRHTRRVAVKRPRHAGPLANCRPDASIAASRIRFDLYFNAGIDPRFSPECAPCAG